jgi:hypothetical protein
MRADTPALRLYRGLLCLYPAEFREHFAGEMCRALADRLRDGPGAAELLAMYFGVLIDAPREHYHMIRQDIVYALRGMRREKIVTAVAILVLALGIGSTVTVFTLVNGMLLRALPYPEPQRLVYVEETTHDGRLSGAMAYPNFLDFWAQPHAPGLRNVRVGAGDAARGYGSGAHSRGVGHRWAISRTRRAAAVRPHVYGRG